MVALLVFATAMTGLLLTHLEARRGAAEALQRSVATLLAQDLLERIRGNPAQAATYATLDLAGGSAGLARPQQDCTSSACTPLQLAHYDLWHWQFQLHGFNERQEQRVLGGLASPDACISLSSHTVTLALVWLGVSAAESSDKLPCAIPDTGLYDDPAHPPGNNLRRRVFTVTTGLEQVTP
jgi:type IV pilus assembly protein PilV